MQTRTPFFQVLLENEDISQWVESVTVTEDDREADAVTVRVPDPLGIYGDSLIEGSTIEVDMGYAEAEEHAVVIRAVITRVEINYPRNGVPTLTLKGEDRSIELALEEKRKCWSGQTVTSVVRAIAEPYGFFRIETSLDPDPMLDRRPAVQDGKTDLAFLQELAREYRAKCFVELDENDREVLYFIPERAVLTSRREDRYPVSYRQNANSNLMSFSPRFDSSYIDRLRRINDVDDNGESFESQDQGSEEDIHVWTLNAERLRGASAEDQARIEILYTRGATRKTELQARLVARRATTGEVSPGQDDVESRNRFELSRRLGLSARGTARGDIFLRAKAIVDASGLGQRLDGDWYVGSVTHEISRNGFQSSFKCWR